MFFITVVVLSSKLELRTHSKVVREKKVPAEVIFLQNLSSEPVQPFLTFLDDCCGSSRLKTIKQEIPMCLQAIIKTMRESNVED